MPVVSTTVQFLTGELHQICKLERKIRGKWRGVVQNCHCCRTYYFLLKSQKNSQTVRTNGVQ